MGWGYWPKARRGEIFPNWYESTTRKEKEREEERESSIHRSNSSYEYDVSFGDGSIPFGIKAWTDSTAIPFLTFELIWPLIGGKIISAIVVSSEIRSTKSRGFLFRPKRDGNGGGRLLAGTR